MYAAFRVAYPLYVAPSKFFYWTVSYLLRAIYEGVFAIDNTELDCFIAAYSHWYISTSDDPDGCNSFLEDWAKNYITQADVYKNHIFSSVTDLLVCNMEEDTNNEIFDEVWDLYGEMKSQR